jgi:hypothetical protein
LKTIDTLRAIRDTLRMKRALDALNAAMDQARRPLTDLVAMCDDQPEYGEE